jgi:hypothetical protein
VNEEAKMPQLSVAPAKTWLDRVLENPAAMFATPALVLRDERLDEFGMREVLEAWRGRARPAPNGDGDVSLQDVEAALAELARRERGGAVS